MAFQSPYDLYELVVGLEVHVQLNTQSKLFSRESTAFGNNPNTQVSAITLGLPGALPFMNKEVLKKATLMGLALNCQIEPHNFFERKNYFYGDLPKGYQTTQDQLPIAKNGYLEVRFNQSKVEAIRINRIHMEEDAGKSIHDLSAYNTAIDLNRAGVPLIEIVTEPDINQAETAAAFINEIRQIVRALGISDGNMEEGSLRCDANISVMKKGATTYGTRCEVKNINSMRNLKRAIAHEFKRQVEVLEAGGSILQSTLNFDAETGETSVMRSKENAPDYRYFPCPDLPPLELTASFINELKENMPKLPAQIAMEIVEEAELTYAEALIIALDEAGYDFYLKAKTQVKQIKALVNWLIGPLRNYIQENNLRYESAPFTPTQIAEIINLVEAREISMQVVMNDLLPKIYPEAKVSSLIDDLNLRISDNETDLMNYISEVLSQYKTQVEAFKKGKKGVLGLFVGEVMKKAKGKADPQKVNSLILEKLNEI
ncbi:MAG: Asp-tRNA(Asn)/Glu-tRNA(Gln) amidotransferase subunit GatB [Pedobacter sp.]|nr:MAG: Asp-tRNA(Asn)/Glu-tRNA(Gln) amidotransferase subunit GatB [Pedobacter sp.]